MRMRWMVAGRCVVLLNISGPRQRDLHRPPGRARAQRGEQRVGAHEQLAAEAAADEGRDQADVLLGDAERLGEVAARSSRSSGSTVQSVSLSPFQAAIEACGSIIAWAWSGVV